jgi:hypothetical protein
MMRVRIETDFADTPVFCRMGGFYESASRRRT